VQDRKDQINRVTVEIYNEEYIVKGEENTCWEDWKKQVSGARLNLPELFICWPM
jgi:hypothetical protein